MATLRTATILLDALPSAGADGLIELVVCVTGEWVRGSHKFSITREDLRTIADNFKKRKNGAIVLDYEHASEMPEVAKGGPVPAAGWIRQVSANGSLRARAELPRRDQQRGRDRVHRCYP